MRITTAVMTHSDPPRFRWEDRRNLWGRVLVDVQKWPPSHCGSDWMSKPVVHLLWGWGP